MAVSRSQWSSYAVFKGLELQFLAESEAVLHTAKRSMLMGVLLSLLGSGLGTPALAEPPAGTADPVSSTAGKALPAPEPATTQADTPPTSDGGEELFYQKPRITVTDLTWEPRIAEGYSEKTKYIIEGALQGTGRFDIIVSGAGRQENKQLMNEENDPEFFNQDAVAEKGGWEGANYRLTGMITKATVKKNKKGIGGILGGILEDILPVKSWGRILGSAEMKDYKATVQITFHLQDAERGRTVRSFTAEASDKAGGFSVTSYPYYYWWWRPAYTAVSSTTEKDDKSLFGNAIGKACQSLVEQIIEADLFPIQGVVADVTTSGKIVINDLGQNTGIKPGMTFTAYRMEKDISASSGEVIGWSRAGIAGEAEILDVRDFECTARVVRGKISKGDIVEVPDEVQLALKPEDEKKKK